MMLRSGKTSNAWLRLPDSMFKSWATLNGIVFNGVEVAPAPFEEAQSQLPVHESLNSKGLAIVATEDMQPDHVKPLIEIPRDMIISQARVQEMARGDTKLRELLDSYTNSEMTPRIVVMLFLLHQATIANPSIVTKFGRSTSFLDYIKFLPIPPVPTIYSSKELRLFNGTTLVPAVKAKLKNLLSEFKTFGRRTRHITWLAEAWWGRPILEQGSLDDDTEQSSGGSEVDDEDAVVKFEDWVLLDAIYRSRALEWPGEGEAMVPGLDMVNHSEKPSAEYEILSDTGQGVLLMKAESPGVKKGEEICISYGSQKSALEILFSYGFLPADYAESQSILLSVQLPIDDPLAPAKAAAAANANCAPGIRVYQENDEIFWSSEFIWLLLVNEEDGLGFKVLYGQDGERELRTTWKDKEIDVRNLKDILKRDDMWDLYQLRATVMVMQRVEEQLTQLTEAEAELELELELDPGSINANENDVEGPYAFSQRLREIEKRLLDSAMNSLDAQKSTLIQSPIVQSYLDSVAGRQSEAEEEHVSQGSEEAEDFT